MENAAIQHWLHLDPEQYNGQQLRACYSPCLPPRIKSVIVDQWCTSVEVVEGP